MRGEYVHFMRVCVCVWKFDKSEEEILNRKNIRLDGSGPRERIYSDDSNSIILYVILEELPVLKVKMRK